jgi:DNA-binding CsgD family transcriptional regulator
MSNNWLIKYIFIVVFVFSRTLIFGISINSTLKGVIEIDSTWERSIYLSHIPTIDKLYSMSNDMIITKAVIDSLGNFQFIINFLPKTANLYRLHLTKVGNSPNSLIIGGRDENYMFVILNRDTSVTMEGALSEPPFKNISFTNSELNTSLNKISRLIHKTDSIASESDFLMNQFLDSKLNEELLEIADTSSNFLISLFALYHSDIESSNLQNQEVINSFLNKWDNKENVYLSSFQNKIYPSLKDANSWYIIVTAILCLSIGFLIGKLKIKTKKGIEELSVQERKVYELLKTGASNQEIAENFNIGLSTVKTHVSKILNKLNVKSRKELMNRK